MRPYRLGAGSSRGCCASRAAGSRSISLGGKKADAFVAQLQKALNRPPKDATFAVSGSAVRIVPDLPGRALNIPATADNIVSAALSPTGRTALVVVQTSPAKRTAKDAKAMGVKELVSIYTTEFGGVPNRIHNVQLVSHLIDGTLIAPGATFSFNGTTGDRNASKGFLEAPVIINGELTTGLGGGVCQVSTTVFNAAYEAGPRHHRADESRALHQPLPAGPRRDRQLPRHRPQVRQRHEGLAARPHVRLARTR